MDRNKLWEILKEMGIPDHLIFLRESCMQVNKQQLEPDIEKQTTLPASSETCMQVNKQQLESDMEQQTGSKLEKEYVKAVYCHPL